MNLLLTRTQSPSSAISIVPLKIGSTVTFKLNAEFELDAEERALTKKYGFQNATLIYSDLLDDLRRAFTPAWYLGLVAMILVAFLYNPSYRDFSGIILKISVVPTIGILTVLIMTVVYFFSLRKFVTVDQMLNGGRTFLCHSVVELDDLEQELKDLAMRFHNTLEKAKNWGGRELNPIPEGEVLYLSNDEYHSRKTKLKTTSQTNQKPSGVTESQAPPKESPPPPPTTSPPPTQTSEPPQTTQSSPHPLAPRPPSSNE